MQFSLETFLPEVAQILEVPAHSLNENSDTSSVATWDSMRSMMLAMMVEGTYGISLTGAEMQRFTSIQNIVAILTDPNRA